MGNRNARGILAMEDIQDGDAPDAIDEVRSTDVASAENEAEATAIEADDAMIGEGEATIDALDAQADALEEVEGTEGEIRQAEVAVEHLIRRLGRSGIKAVSPAFESATGKDRKTLLVAAARSTSARACQQLSVAQEGFLDRIGNGILKYFKDDVKIAADIDEFYRKVKKNGTKNASINGRAFSRIFNITAGGKTTVEASDIIATLKRYDQEINAKLVPKISAANRKLFDIAKAVDKSSSGWKGWFVSNPDQVEKIKALYDELAKIRREAEELFGDDVNKAEKKEVTIAPISVEDAKKIADIATDVISNRSLQKALMGSESDYWKLVVRVWGAAGAYSIMRDDVQAVVKGHDDSARFFFKMCYELSKLQYEVGFSASRLLKNIADTD